MPLLKLTEIEELGGFHSLEIIRKEDVYQTPIILTNANISEFKYHKHFDNELEVMPVGESIIIAGKPKRKPEGLIYNVKSSFEVVSPDRKVDDMFYKYMTTKVLVKARKYNGTAILYGSKQFPLTLIYEHKHSKKLETITEMVVSISGKIPQKPVFMPTW